MRELGMVIVGCMVFAGFFSGVIYPNLEYKGYSRVQTCTGECYEEYVRTHGTVVEIEQRKKELANADEFSSIRSLWAGCAACHGNDGGGIGAFPKLAGQTKDYIINRLTQYKNGEQVGAQSAIMWGQAGMLSENDIETLGKFIEVELK
mgnify:CR=1 FL=1|tara:strand:- start:6773 stop:7216 length:444 start_codon:yes stop_codon:yes gene_type:complete